MADVFIGLGTNLGDRLALMRDAVSQLRRHIDVSRISPVYETEPVGYLDQPRFLNAVVSGTTDLEPHDLLARLHEIEAALDRERPFPNAPRTIDLDLLFYDDLIINDEAITVPHPRLHERLFVLVPLNDIAPGFVHPGIGMTVSELRSGFDEEWNGTVVDTDLSDIASS